MNICRVALFVNINDNFVRIITFFPITFIGINFTSTTGIAGDIIRIDICSAGAADIRIRRYSDSRLSASRVAAPLYYHAVLLCFS